MIYIVKSTRPDGCMSKELRTDDHWMAIMKLQEYSREALLYGFANGETISVSVEAHREIEKQ